MRAGQAPIDARRLHVLSARDGGTLRTLGQFIDTRTGAVAESESMSDIASSRSTLAFASGHTVSLHGRPTARAALLSR
jgi:hypothetical protein